MRIRHAALTLLAMLLVAAAPATRPAPAPPEWTRVWESAPIPDGRAPDGSDKSQTTLSGGFGSPVVADGRVYFQYYVPSGTAYDKPLADKAMTYTAGVTKDKWLIDADDVVVCLDAATGKEVWRRTFAGRGLNWGAFNKGGPQLTPAVDKQRVYVRGTLGVVWALDAATGKVLWEGSIGPRAGAMAALKRLAIEKQSLPRFNRDFAGGPVIAGAALVLPDHAKHKLILPAETKTTYHYESKPGLVALDAATGKPVWTAPQVASGDTTPVVVTAGARTLVVTGDESQLIAIDAASGEVAFKTDAARGNEQPVVIDGVVLANATRSGVVGVAALRVDAGGFVDKWFVPGAALDTMSSPAVAGDKLFFVSRGKMTCVRLETGEVLARADIKAAGGFVVATGGKVLAQQDASHVRPGIIVIDAESMKPQGEVAFDLAGTYTTPILPAVTPGGIVLRLRDRLMLVKSP